jgi:hypothetical protein
VKNTKRVVAAARKRRQLPEWLGRSMCDLPFCLTLCTSEKMFIAEQKRLGVKLNNLGTFAKPSGANFVFYERGEFEDPTCLPAGIVTINGAEVVGGKISSVQAFAMLAHEATHAVQRAMSMLGERLPSDEFQAYAVQLLTQRLGYEFARQMGLPT